MTFGEKLRERRRERGDSRERAAAEIGVSLMTVRNYEREASRPIAVDPEVDIADRLERLADYLGISVPELLAELGIVRRERYERDTESMRSKINSPPPTRQKAA